MDVLARCSIYRTYEQLIN